MLKRKLIYRKCFEIKSDYIGMIKEGKDYDEYKFNIVFGHLVKLLSIPQHIYDSLAKIVRT